MNAILVVNHFLNSSKYTELHRHLIESARTMDIELKLYTNLQLATKNADADFALFWDKDINLARSLEARGIPVFNSADSIEKCDDKARTYIELKDIVNQPKTLIAPKTFFKADMSDFVDNAIDILGLPLVFKECFGSFGEQVYLCSSRDDIISHISEKPFILQEFIEKSCGCDKRLEIVGDKCICAARRENANDFRSNVTNGGTMTPCTPSDDEIETAIKACKRLGLCFGGVDILDGGMVCEVNSNAHIINIMEATGIDIAPVIFEEILEKNQMSGILIYTKEEAKRNAFAIQKFKESLDIKLVEPDYNGDADFVINRTNDYRISQRFEERGIRVFNPSALSKLANDKQLCYDFMEKNGVEIMPTRYNGLPVIKKPIDGHGGAGVEMLTAQEAHQDGFVYQKPCATLGKDLRVWVIGKKIITAILRESDTDFRSNFCLGGNATPYDLSPDEIKFIKKIINLVDSDYIGIDFLFNNGKLIFNEIEDTVGARMVYTKTNIDIIKLYCDYIEEQL